MAVVLGTKLLFSAAVPGISVKLAKLLPTFNVVDKKIELERESISDALEILTQKTSQLESIERLVKSAEERLSREKDEIEQMKQEIEFSENPEEKQSTEDRLRSILNHIKEVYHNSEITGWFSEIRFSTDKRTTIRISSENADYLNSISQVVSQGRPTVTLELVYFAAANLSREDLESLV